MDDHDIWTNDYFRALRREAAQRLLVAVLVLSVFLTGWLVYQTWSTRHMQIFRPIAGLSYEPPTTLEGIEADDIAGPLSFQKLSPNDAFRFNASIPVSTEPFTPSRPFVLPAELPQIDASRALDCLTAAVYYEAASESTLGQQAVAQVILNRLRHPAFPRSICGVVFSGSTRTTGCQFTFTCDGSLARRPAAAQWERARRIAQAALSGHVTWQVGQATHYHTLWVAPYWSPSLVKVANIGAHTFYRWKGSIGAPGAFIQAYRGAEPATPLATDESNTSIDPGIIEASAAPSSVRDPVPNGAQFTEERPIDEVAPAGSREPLSAPAEAAPVPLEAAPAAPPRAPSSRRRVAVPQ